jgi:hypothetical protein
LSMMSSDRRCVQHALARAWHEPWQCPRTAEQIAGWGGTAHAAGVPQAFPGVMTRTVGMSVYRRMTRCAARTRRDPTPEGAAQGRARGREPISRCTTKQAPTRPDSPPKRQTLAAAQGLSGCRGTTPSARISKGQLRDTQRRRSELD